MSVHQSINSDNYEYAISLHCEKGLTIDLSAILRKGLDRALLSGVSALIAIDDYAKDGDEELFTKMHCVL